MSAELSETIKRVMSDEGDVREATASHQAEFPYGRDPEAQVTRREFCNFLFLTSSALFVGAAGFAAKAAYDAREPGKFYPERIEGAETLEPGSALNFAYPGKEDSAILIRAKDGSYNAFGQKIRTSRVPSITPRQMTGSSVLVTRAVLMPERVRCCTAPRRVRSTR